MTQVLIEPITAKIGAYVKVAPEAITQPGVPEQILAALNEYNVVVFPQINMSDEQFLALTKSLGPYEPPKTTLDGSDTANKGIYRIALDKSDKSQLEYVKGNDFWHMDGTSYSVPGKGTLLKCERAPSEGGDTGFANLYAAYEAMPPAMKQKLAGLRVVHCMEAVGIKLYQQPAADDLERWNTVFPRTEHPLVWQQKDGRTSLVIGATAMDIVGMPHEQGYALLQELKDWCTQEQFTYRHKWQKGDVVIFNNPGLMHRSYPYDEASGRLMHRTTLKGTEAFA